jgi:hypothetical protein
MLRRFAAKGTLVFVLLVAFSPSHGWAQGSEYIFPHMVDGESGTIFYSTSFLLNNASNLVTSVTIRFFRSNGTPWMVDLRSFDRNELAGRASSRTFNLQPREAVELFTGGTDPLAAGWARIDSGMPIDSSEVFGVFNKSPVFLRSEAGVLPALAATLHTLYTSVSTDEPATGTSVDTGIAIANLSGAQAVVTATLFDRVGVQLTQGTLTLPANNHTAMFVSQIFNNFSFSGRFHGMVRFTSNVNIAVVGLRQAYGDSDTISTLAVNPDSNLGRITIYDREPNDSRPQAQPLGSLPAEIPVEIIGTMNTPADGGDTDQFSVNLRVGEVLYVFAVADLIGSPLDDVITIRDSLGAQVATNDTFSAGLRDPFIRFPVSINGVYYIEHSGAGGTSGRNSHYRLHVLVR